MTLSIEQRLNLIVLVGNLQCKTLADTRAAWNLMDRLELSDEEKKTVDFVVHQVNGSPGYNWNNDKAPAPREVDVSEAEIKQLRLALESAQGWLPGVSRRWLKPLLEQMSEQLPEQPGSEA